VFFEQSDLAAFGARLAIRADFDLVERDAMEIGQCARARMVADNKGDFAGEFAGLVAVKEIREAMQVLGNEDVCG